MQEDETTTLTVVVDDGHAKSKKFKSKFTLVPPTRILLSPPPPSTTTITTTTTANGDDTTTAAPTNDDVHITTIPTTNTSITTTTVTTTTVVPIMEYSVHSIPLILRDDIRTIFPCMPSVRPLDHAHVILVMQPCVHSSMTEFTPESEREKGDLLVNFERFARELRREIWSQQQEQQEQQQEHAGSAVGDLNSWWFDYSDPISGYPAHSQHGGRCFSDVDVCEMLLHYRVDTVGGTCRLLSHPTWSTAVYPTAILTCHIPLPVIEGAIRRIAQVQQT